MSDPREIARKQLQKNFPKFGGIRKLVKFQSRPLLDPDTDYNTTTGVVTLPAPIEFNVWFIFDSTTSFKELQSEDNPILAIDKVAIVPALDMVYDPKTEDTFVGSDLITWRVIGILDDPAQASWQMWVRPNDRS